VPRRPGRQSRIEYECWFASLPDGAYRYGAMTWAANRSLSPDAIVHPARQHHRLQAGWTAGRGMPALVDLRRNTVKGYLGAGTNCEAIKGLRRQTADGQAVQQILLVVQEELAAERLVAHSNAEDALAEALEGCHDAEGRLREAIAAQEARKRAQALLKGRERPNAIGSKPGALAGWDIDREPRAKAPGSPTIADDGRPK
jgi:hypothetical protein